MLQALWLIPVVLGNLPLDSFNNAFYVSDGSSAYFKVDTSGGIPNRLDFWRVCETIEVVEDAFERSGRVDYKEMVTALVTGLNGLVSKTDDWTSWNHFNDDIMWGVIMLVRSYKITGNQAHLTQAEQQFNAAWARGWDDKDGGMFWNTSRITKNACVNGPAAIAAYLLAEETTGTGYEEQARKLFSWLRSNLFNASTGQVYDHVSPDGKVTDWAFTYNQGTFIGAAVLNSAHTADTSLSDARAAALWTRDHLSGQHAPLILNDEYGGKGGYGDGVGFKGIFCRWCARYTNTTGDQDVITWMNVNAEAAWKYRNSVGVTWAQWWHRTPDSKVTSWECSSAAAILQAYKGGNML